MKKTKEQREEDEGSKEDNEEKDEHNKHDQPLFIWTFKVPNLTYKCNTCNKSFDSYHALNGHRNKHRKDKNTLDGIESCNDTEKSKITNGEDFPTPDDMCLKVATVKHQCNICSQAYQTKRALGAHKRKHNSSLEKSGAESSQRKTQLLDFDLNVILPENEENEIDLNGELPGIEENENLPQNDNPCPTRVASRE